jgi:hypothetical protein
LGASSACSRFDKQPLVTKFEISIETLPGMCAAKGYPHVRTKKEKGQMLQLAMNHFINVGWHPLASRHLTEQSFVADNARLATCRITDRVI